MSNGATATATELQSGTWKIDTIHSQVGFEVKHMGVSTFRGRFNDFEGMVVTGDGQITGIEGSIDVTSLDVRDSTLSGHLQSADFLDAENHPQGSLRSTAVEPVGEDRYRLSAELTLRGQTHPVELDLTTNGPHPGMAGTTLGLTGTTEIDRFEYGISWDSKLENGARVVGEKVRLVFEIEAVLEEA